MICWQIASRRQDLFGRHSVVSLFVTKLYPCPVPIRSRSHLDSRKCIHIHLESGMRVSQSTLLRGESLQLQVSPIVLTEVVLLASDASSALWTRRLDLQEDRQRYSLQTLVSVIGKLTMACPHCPCQRGVSAECSNGKRCDLRLQCC